jgi:copper chaperone CopZ
MRRTMAYASRFGIIAIAGLLIGTGAVFALNTGSGTVTDSVAVLKSAGVSCGSCVSRIDKALKEKPGVGTVDVNVYTGLVAVAYDSKTTKPESLAETVTALGYSSSIQHVMTTEEYKNKSEKPATVSPPARTAGCGGCCNKNRN